MVVLIGTRLDALLGFRNGEAWTFFNTCISSQKVARTASEAFADRFTEAFIAVSVASLRCDKNVLDSPCLDVRVILGTERSPFQKNVRRVVLDCELFYFDAVCSLAAAKVLNI